MVTKIQSRNLKFEYVVGYRKNSIKFNIQHCLIKLTGTKRQDFYLNSNGNSALDLVGS